MLNLISCYDEGMFFYGYVATQVPGGRLAELVGGKWLFGLGVLVTSVLTIVTPLAARTNYALFLVVRVVEGLGEGVTFPAMLAMIARWSAPHERSRSVGDKLFSSQTKLNIPKKVE